jgi:hypothetical protein
MGGSSVESAHVEGAVEESAHEPVEMGAVGQTCPVCLQIIDGNNTAFNAHLDLCLNSGAVKIAARGGGSSSSGSLKQVAKPKNNKGKKRQRAQDFNGKSVPRIDMHFFRK